MLSESLITDGNTEAHSWWVRVRAGIPGLSLRVPARNHGESQVLAAQETEDRRLQGHQAGRGPYYPPHQWESRGTGPPPPPPTSAPVELWGGLGPENSQRCEGEGVWWPEAPLSEHLLCSGHLPFLSSCYRHTYRDPRTRQRHQRNNGSLPNVCHVLTLY